LKPNKQGKLPSLEALVTLQIDAAKMQLPEKTVFLLEHKKYSRLLTSCPTAGRGIRGPGTLAV
jgi:hypothetical protein